LLICSPQEMIEKLAPYAELGIDRVILSMNFGAPQTATLESIQRFAEEVMPHFDNTPTQVAAE
ncbi:MAG: LLM class flavin-dependent oxidoreductase, partial [Pseudomonadota bacterium]